MRLPNYRWVILALAGLLVLGATPSSQAESLSARLRHLGRGKAQVQSRIREIRQEQSSATERLYTAQRRLAALQTRLGQARGELTATRGQLDRTRQELARLQKALAQHTKDVQDHLLALYRAGDAGYLGVLLSADSFSDFANRRTFIQAVVNQDQYVLNRLAALQQQAEDKRNQLAGEERRQAALVREIAQDQAEASQREAEVKAILHDANTKRVAAESELAEMEQEEAQVRALVRSHSSSGGGAFYSGSWSGSLLRPVGGPITSPFGMRVHPITGRYTLHTGVDIGASYGTTIHAADKGLVISTGWMRAYGQTVVIDHGSGIHTWYCHCSAVLVSEGQTVSRGQAIARVGSTGMSTGPHLHFSVLRNGDFVNPLGF